MEINEERFVIEPVKDGYRVRVGKKMYLPGVYLTLLQAERAMRAAILTERNTINTKHRGNKKTEEQVTDDA